jgi:hypothetical protein
MIFTGLAGVENPSLLTSRVENAQDESSETQDISPLQAEILWRKLAEENVTDRLETAGVLAPPGDFEKILNQIVTNLELGSNIDIPVQCRVMLTLPVEATVADRTILLSKGLVDTIPSEEALASVLALELAHVALGHRLDTKYAFSDRLLFENPATFLRIRLAHSDEGNRAAAELAKKILASSIYKDRLLASRPTMRSWQPTKSVCQVSPMDILAIL